MKYSLLLVCGLLIGVSAAAQSKTDQNKTSDNAQLVAAADILKIDAKKKILEVRQVVDSTPPPRTRQEGNRRNGGGGNGGGQYPGGGGGGGGRRRGGGGGGAGGGGGRYPGGGGGGRYPGGASSNQAKEYKVYITKDTVFKFANTDIEFNDLHVSDRITISGTPKGSKGDLEATSIIRE